MSDVYGQKGYCHDHGKYRPCSKCQDVLIDIGIQIDKDRIRELEAMATWQPIETMPEDNADDVDARFLQAAQSVPVVGEPIYWIDPDDDANLSRIGRVGWSPLYGESPASIPAADLTRLREKAAEADELRKDAERYRWLRENWFTMTSVYGSNGTVKFQINQNRYSDATEATIDAAIDAAIAQGKGE